MNSANLSELQQDLDSVLLRSPGKSSKSVVEEVVSLHEKASPEVWEKALLSHPSLEEVQHQFTSFYYDYIVKMEHHQADELLQVPTNKDTHFVDVVSDDARAAYERVGDLFSQVDFSGIKNVVMIGCGKLPVTALHIIDRSQVEQVTCLDVLPDSITVAKSLGEKFGWEKITFQCTDGAAFDYSCADFIYVANMVRPKNKVLSRILETHSEGASLVVREPYGLGLLWAESSQELLDAQVKITGYGDGSKFLSRDMFLTL